ncbi:uncharacterized protein B0H18DRAFT_1005652 [Fomitopsis serialis]|uniref:uncharacterized protein n=1 Tax=Fomitopsis serialis TaxID=139415 RepID=UPI0020088CDF|nr:uncharacterized protein B0H18DRAFT_1005652 [Neoantrodia serialis]KAH9926802.1 hypothetical protein B0H18DRAFT_1005652 [Neoantrodia serialis]
MSAQASTPRPSREHFDAQLSTPPVAFTHAPRTQAASLEEGTNAIDDFFGALARHHDDAPPPYSCSSAPPAYTRYAEHPTLAMYLFKFGFRDVPSVLDRRRAHTHLPLRAPEDWELSKTEAEREELIENMRHTEVKWAKRCLIALSVLILVVLTVVLAAVFLTRT